MHADEKEGGGRDLLFHYCDYDDLSQLCSSAKTHSVEIISMCGTLPARPGMSQNPRQASNASKELGGESYPCATAQHQAAITVHLHTASQASPALVLTHSVLRNPGEERCRPGKKLAHSSSK